MDWQIGQIYWTNLSKPGGPVRILKIEPEWSGHGRLAAYIEHVADHPYGYEKGTRGWYYLEDLRELTSDEQAILSPD